MEFETNKSILKKFKRKLTIANVHPVRTTIFTILLLSLLDGGSLRNRKTGLLRELCEIPFKNITSSGSDILRVSARIAIVQCSAVNRVCIYHTAKPTTHPHTHTHTRTLTRARPSFQFIIFMVFNIFIKQIWIVSLGISFNSFFSRHQFSTRG